MGKAIENVVKYATNTADFVKTLFKRCASFSSKVKGKTADFIGTTRYEGKSFFYNQYDKVRSYISLNRPVSEVDQVEYKGGPVPSYTERTKTYIMSKTGQLRSKMPSSPEELRQTVVKNHKTSKRARRAFFLNAKENMAEVFASVKEYVLGVRKSTVVGLSSVAVGGLVLTLMLTTIVNSYAMGVTINGEKVGFVENEEEFATLVEDVKQELSKENYNTNIEIDEQAIELDSMAKSKDEVEMLDETQLKEKLIKEDAIAASAATITVDGKPIVNVASKEDAYGVLKAIRQKYDVSGQDVFAGFVQDVSVKQAEIDVSNITPNDTAITYLLTGNKTVEKYTAKDNDTLWDIAVANGLTEKEILAANPHLKADKIKKGDTVNLSKTVPFVHMEIVATVNVTEKTNYDTKKVETNDLYEGETKVVKEGKRGQKSITKRAVYINGKEKSADIIEEKVISKPVNRVVQVGTKSKPGYSSGGSSSYSSGGGSYSSSNRGVLGNPMRSMILSSPFGNRGGRFHSGDDYRNPAGTPIYAAAGGRVTYSGYDGAYGNTVRISHGNGMVTVYAHCNSLNVRSGASVSKGQQIATVGRTGRATGNHLHFEVRINGSAQNPRNYL